MYKTELWVQRHRSAAISGLVGSVAVMSWCRVTVKHCEFNFECMQLCLFILVMTCIVQVRFLLRLKDWWERERRFICVWAGSTWGWRATPGEHISSSSSCQQGGTVGLVITPARAVGVLGFDFWTELEEIFFFFLNWIELSLFFPNWSETGTELKWYCIILS